MFIREPGKAGETVRARVNESRLLKLVGGETIEERPWKGTRMKTSMRKKGETRARQDKRQWRKGVKGKKKG